MKATLVNGPGSVEVVDVPRPSIGASDVLVKVRACGICGSDTFYIARGGIPPREGATPLGHEIAGEVVEAGPDVEGIAIGDHVVVNPMAAPSGIIGNGGATGGLADYLHIENARLGVSLAIVPEEVPFEVAALNEPMAVARHAVNRLNPQSDDKAVVFGAGPIGLGATIDLKLRGAHVVVVDILPTRLKTALTVGADAIINSAEEDVAARLLELHGAVPAGGGRGPRPGTDLFLDAAGAPGVIETVLANVKHGATLCIPAVHKKPVSVDFGSILSAELTIVMAMGYPTEIFEVTSEIVENWQRYAHIISDRVPFSDVEHALTLAATPGAAEKVIVTFDPAD